MKLNRIVKKYLNLCEHRLEAAMAERHEDIIRIDKKLNKVRNQLTHKDGEQIEEYLKEQAEKANVSTGDGKAD